MKASFLREKKSAWFVNMLMFENSDSDFKGHNLDMITYTWGKDGGTQEGKD